VLIRGGRAWYCRKGDDTAPDEVEEAVKKAVVAGTTLTRSGYRYVRAGGSAGTLHTAGESKRLVVESPWSQLTSECQRFRYPPRLDK
jgi:hypothetical protein